MQSSNVASRRPVAEVRSPSEQRLIALFDANYDRIVRFCTVRSGSSSVGADTAADTFADAARALAREPDLDLDVSWLYMVARRRLTDHWRQAERQRRRIRRFIDQNRHLASADQGDEIADRVGRALDALPDRQRSALTLRYLDGYSVLEVAEALEISYRAAESALARARRAFTTAWNAS